MGATVERNAEILVLYIARHHAKARLAHIPARTHESGRNLIARNWLVAVAHAPAWHREASAEVVADRAPHARSHREDGRVGAAALDRTIDRDRRMVAATAVDPEPRCVARYIDERRHAAWWLAIFPQRRFVRVVLKHALITAAVESTTDLVD